MSKEIIENKIVSFLIQKYETKGLLCGSRAVNYYSSGSDWDLIVFTAWSNKFVRIVEQAEFSILEANFH